jgi:PleD family two-component response regulator
MARQFLRESRVACVLLDLTLPDSRALDGLVDLRNVAPELPIVVVTADDDESRAVKAVQAGAQDYLIKGRIDSERLYRSVMYAMERKRGELLLAHQALHDPLTGLPNRTLFIDRLTLALAQSLRRTTSVAVLFSISTTSSRSTTASAT